MKLEAQIIAIAEFYGWKPYEMYHDKVVSWRLGDDCRKLTELPNYPKDLNAMREIEKKVLNELWYSFFQHLRCICENDLKNHKVETLTNNEILFACITASAAQHTEAILRTFNLWED